jgi:hypothetical protein
MSDDEPSQVPPICWKCGIEMTRIDVEPDIPNHRRHVFVCHICDREEVILERISLT